MFLLFFCISDGTETWLDVGADSQSEEPFHGLVQYYIFFSAPLCGIELSLNIQTY